MKLRSSRLQSSGDKSLDRKVFDLFRKHNCTVLGAGAATPVLGPELVAPLNFNTGWTAVSVIVTGANSFSTTSGAGMSFPLAANKSYIVTTAGTTTGGAQICTLQPGVASTMIPNSFGTSCLIQTTATQTFLYIRNQSAGATTIDNISVKEITGYTYGNPPVRNYFDSAGTDILDSVTQVDQPVGLVLDGAGTVGPELFSYVSGDAGVSHNGGVITFASVAVSAGATGAVTLATGKSYQVTFTVTGFTAGGVSVKAGSIGTTGVAAAANGTFTEVFSPTGSSGPLQFVARYATSTLTVSNISVKELPGNHATQPTTGSKPTLRRGLVNQLLWSGDFSNAAWVKQQLTVATNVTPAPDGGTCFKLTEDTATALHRIEQNWTATAGATYTIAVVVKAAERTWARLFEDSGGGSAWVNLADGALGSVANGAAASTHLGNGWHLLVLTYAQTGTTLRFRLNTATANNIGSYAGDGTSGILLHRAALYQGTVTAQQILDAGGIPLTTTAPASSALGNYWWQFSPDAPGDFFSTGISTGATGWMCAGITFSAVPPAALQVLGTTATGGLDGAGLLVTTGGTSLLMSVGNGTTQHFASQSAPAVGVPAVVEGWWDSSTVTVALNGIETSAARSGVATSPGTLTIGARQVSPLAYLNGAMSVTIICPTLPPSADRALIRAWVAKQQGQTL